MPNLKEKTIEIMKIWRTEHNIKEISVMVNESYEIIRNNYFKQFWKNNYLIRVGRGKYILNQKGEERIKENLKNKKADDLILKLSKTRKSNKIIKKELKTKIGVTITDSSIFSKIYRLRKKENIPKRNLKEINKIKINKDFYEFLGLILSDGYISKYCLDFYNKDQSLLNYYKKIVNENGLVTKERKKESGVTAQTIHSIKMVKLVNKFLNNKNELSEKITKVNKKHQKHFLKGVYSGDGSICLSLSYRKSKKRWRVEPFISLAVFNDKIIHSIVEILEENGFNPRKSKDTINLNKKKDIKRFYDKIRFINGSKIRKSKYWNGIEKNKVLKYSVCYLNKDIKLKHLKKQGEKEQIINHIKERLAQM